MSIDYRVAYQAWPDADFELRAVGDGMEFRGYAAIFNVQSEDLGGFRERIMPGAFTRSINAASNGSADIRMFWNHDSGRLLGSTKAKTLRLSQDEYGLLAEASLPDTSDGRDMSALIRRGDVRSMSFGFSVPRNGDKWNATHNERDVIEARTYEVSPVTGWPAYSATSASVRHLFGMADWSDDDSIRSLIDILTPEQCDAFRRLLTTPPSGPLEVDAIRARLEAKYAHI